jgi:hypothetical protein
LEIGDFLDFERVRFFEIGDFLDFERVRFFEIERV